MEKNMHSIEAKCISMTFPGVKALDNVDFSMHSGEIRALIGANGAGKSTLMNVFAGALPGYEGKVIIDGKQVWLSSPTVAKQYGIALVSQEVDNGILPNVSVAENILFDKLVNKMGKRSFLNWHQIREDARKALSRLNQDIDVTMQAGLLSLAQKQMVLIARAISQECSFLILDEPTSALSVAETEQLFAVIRDLMANEDIGVIFISHRLNELFEICDTITVMRNGRIVADHVVDGVLTAEDIVADMLGDTAREPFVREKSPVGPILFEARDLHDTEGKVNGVSIKAFAGEVIGISGLVGAGKTELAKCIYGAVPKKSGKILVKGKEEKITSPTKAVSLNIGLVPEERRNEGVMVSHSIRENLSFVNLREFTKAAFVQSKREKSYADDMVKRVGIKTPDSEQIVANLSGGNQQKVVFGKWLGANSEIYLMDEPTKGVDVGAKQEIFRLIQQLTDAGKCVIYLSSESSEILSVTDRVYVLYNGKIAAEMDTKDATEDKLLYYGTGGK